MIETCEQHGEYESEEQVILGTAFKTGCPECLEKESAQYDETAEKVKAQEKADKYDHDITLAGIPKRFINCTFSNYETKTPAQVEALEMCKKFYEQILSGTDSALFLVGNCGTGKNHLAISILLNLIRRELKKGIYTKVGKMIRDIRSSYGRNDGPTEQQIIDKYVHAPVLILNEVGVQYGTDGEKVLLFEVLDGRYEEMKPTIIISNLSISEMTAFLGERVMDRLKSKAGMVAIFDWESHRGNV